MKSKQNERTYLRIIKESQKLLTNVSEVLEKSSHDLKDIIDDRQGKDAAKIITIVSSLEFLSNETSTASVALDKHLKEMNYIDGMDERWGL